MISSEILADIRLTGTDLRVLGWIILQRRGKFVNVGERRIAELSHIDRRSVRRSRDLLLEYGHIIKKPTARGFRAQYILASAVFSAREVKALTEDEVKPAAPRCELVSCPRCHCKCKSLLKIGYCRTCRWTDKVAGIADDRIDKKIG